MRLMFIIDVNVLLYALDRTSPGHAGCLRWLERAGHGDELVGISSQVMSSVIRIATHPSVFDRPLTAEHAIEFLEDLRNLPAFFAAEPGAGHWSLFTEVILKHRLQRGGLTDGWLAALALELGGKLVTTDAGFSRFRGLQILNPLRSR